jgi:N-acetylmuramoyl-L-alanine amidase
MKQEIENLKAAHKAIGEAIKAIEIALENPKESTPKLKNKATIYLNAGHGGMLNGKYMTFPEHGKFYQFTGSQGNPIETAYEGVLNRNYAKVLEAKLLSVGFNVVKTYHETNDMTNQARAIIANNHYNSTPNKRSCWVSIHFNASGMTSKGIGQSARGACIFTLNGQNESDKIAQSVWSEFKERTKTFNITYREDLRDGDGDHEAGFEEFNLTLMPAYLIETLFFDNWHDFQIAKRNEFVEAVTDAHLYGLLNYFNSL